MRMTSTPAPTASLAVTDRLEILDLYARYNHTVDAGDLEAWVRCFTADGTVEAPPAGAAHRGAEALKEFATRFRRRTEGRAHHVTSDVELWADGAEVHGRASLLMILAASAPAAPAILISARYADRLRRTADGWRFAHRLLIDDATREAARTPDAARLGRG